MATRENYIALFDNLLALEANKKELSESIKIAVEEFAEEHDLSKKGIKKALKEYKEVLKNEAEFNIVDSTADEILNTITSRR